MKDNGAPTVLLTFNDRINSQGSHHRPSDSTEIVHSVMGVVAIVLIESHAQHKT
jgi:hypothetical protein